MHELHRFLEEQRPSLQQAIGQSLTPAEARHVLESYIDKLRERCLQTLPLTHEPVVVPIFRLFSAATGYLDGIVWERQSTTAPLPTKTGSTPHLAGEDVRNGNDSAFSSIKIGLAALLLISLFSTLSQSWLVGVAFLLALALLLLEMIPVFSQVRERFLLQLGRGLPGFIPRSLSFPSRQSDLESSTPTAEQATYRLRLNTEQIHAVLERMAVATDEVIAAVGDLLQRHTGNTHHEHLSWDRETIQLLQHLLRDAQQADAKYIRERIRQIPDLLKAQGLRLVVYEDVEDKNTLDEYFQIFVDPSVAAITTLLPAIVAKDGVIVEGRVVFPHSTLQKG
jgi:hypothetical protein